MNIRDRHAIHEAAADALTRATEARRIVLVYGLICCGLSLVSTIVTSLLGNRIAGTGGLGNIGIRSILSTVQSVLPMVNLIVTSCLGLGYHTAMLCYTRGFDADTHTLMSGFRHFGAVIRTMLLEIAVYTGAGFFAVYLSSFIFIETPFAADFTAVMEPVISSMTVMDTTLEIEPAAVGATLDADTAIDDAYWNPSQFDIRNYVTLNEDAIRKVVDQLGEKYNTDLHTQCL